MALPRKSTAVLPPKPTDGSETKAEIVLKRAAPIPPRIAAMAFVDDASRSMGAWHASRTSFLKRLRDKVRQAGGEKVLDVVYVSHVAVSTAVVCTKFAPLRDAVGPEIELDGTTPLGTAFSRLAEETETFFADTVLPNEVTVRPFRVVVVSDLFPSGETDEATERGVAAFAAMAKKYRAEVTLVGPSVEHTNDVLAARLDVTGAGVQYLDKANPDDLLQWSFDSVLKAARPLRPRPAVAE